MAELASSCIWPLGLFKTGSGVAQVTGRIFANTGSRDADSYKYYRKFLLETTQIGGGFYTQRGRAELLHRLVDLMLAPTDSYSLVLSGNEPDLRLVLVASRHV